MTRIRCLTISDQFYKTVFLGFSLFLVVLGLVQILDLVYNGFCFLVCFRSCCCCYCCSRCGSCSYSSCCWTRPPTKTPHLTAVTIASAICNVQNGRATLIQCFYNMLLPFPQGCQFSWKMVQQGSHSLWDIIYFHLCSYYFPCYHGAESFWMSGC